MSEKIKKEYTNGEITIVWQPSKCLHSGICVKSLPNVYLPKSKPWINPENASAEAIKAQIKKCPSGALSYYMNGEETKEAESLETKAELLENGPLVAYGIQKFIDKEGNEEIISKTTALCKCGDSANKPYCDGTHVKVDFREITKD